MSGKPDGEELGEGEFEGEDADVEMDATDEGATDALGNGAEDQSLIKKQDTNLAEDLDGYNTNEYSNGDYRGGGEYSQGGYGQYRMPPLGAAAAGAAFVFRMFKAVGGKDGIKKRVHQASEEVKQALAVVEAQCGAVASAVPRGDAQAAKKAQQEADAAAALAEKERAEAAAAAEKERLEKEEAEAAAAKALEEEKAAAAEAERVEAELQRINKTKEGVGSDMHNKLLLFQSRIASFEDEMDCDAFINALLH